MPSSSSQLRSPPPTSPAGSIAGDRLGLDPSDLAVLYQHQSLAHAQVQSPAGSAGSSQGRLLLDPGSLQLLTRHFDRIMQAIQERLEAVRYSTPIRCVSITVRCGKTRNAVTLPDIDLDSPRKTS
jgi:hypothetical protein